MEMQDGKKKEKKEKKQNDLQETDRHGIKRTYKQRTRR
jgi:hypothetical protein